MTARRAAVALMFLAALPATAHPGSGIVADRSGQIYFVDTGAGVWTIDAHGVLSAVPGPRFHWMTIDPEHRLAKAKLPSGPDGDITRAGTDGALLVASDTPLAIGSDGNLYFPSRAREGRVQILKMTPAGDTSARAGVPLPFLNGLAAGPDGSLYATGNDTIRKIDKEGRVSLVVSGLALAGCPAIPGIEAKDGPFLRGLDVDAHGAIVVAATGCGRVLRIAPDGKAATILQVQPPWSPTAVVEAGSTLYVLEYLHTATEDRKAWRPRVRKIAADGTSAVLATVNRP